jgi:hypothetical protein
MKLFVVALAVFLLNLPFGYWRAGVRRFSWQWIVAIHAPVPGVVALRLASGLGFQFTTYPVLIAAFFLGQRCGGGFRRPSPSAAPAPRSALPPGSPRA